jgi:hypothetical protein
MSQITVIKCDAAGNEVLSYTGYVLDRGPGWVRLQAEFDHDAVTIGGLTLAQGDRMVEWFYSDRYYNVFRVHTGADGPIKGWYCNITRPAQISATQVAADDLELDLVVLPDGSTALLDEDEFDALDLSATERSAALDAVTTLRTLAAHGEGPFEDAD